MEPNPTQQDTVVGTAGFIIKIFALIDIYAFAGHPYIYLDLWRKGMWYIWIPLALIAPAALYWAVSVLTWWVRVDLRNIRFVSVAGFLERPIIDVTRVELLKGNLVIVFGDGKSKVVPMFVQNLSALRGHIERRLQDLQTNG